IQGPVYDINLAAGDSIDRDRTVFVPGSAPAGGYFCIGMIGTYPWTIIDSDAFTFTKEGTNGIWVSPDGWICTGEPFPVEEAEATLTHPSSFRLYPPHPNPFNPTTTLTFTLPQAGLVKLEVFDVKGRSVGAIHELPLHQWFPAGTHQITFNGSGLPSGIYFYRLTAEDWQGCGKLVLLK
ncbi:MAG: T9SS type A sorting domain-containing protein, partial [bacterium]